MTPLSEYLKQIEKALQAGDATEHTHRPALKALIESLSKGLTATNEPKHIACGAPDFIVTKGGVPLGYIECKDVGEPLDKVERGEQMVRYFSLGNVLLTDYLEFRWYVLGERRLSGRLASVGAKDKLKPEKDGAEQVDQLLKAFIDAEVPTVGTPKELAERMAALAQIIRDAIRHALEGEERSGSLHQQMEGFRKVLLHDLTVEQFADMYAQTLCYGLFAARYHHPAGKRFTREHAAYELPNTNPFLRWLFGYVAGPKLDERIVWAVDDLAELLNRADMSAITKDFGKRTRQEDPVVHFYETFLSEYDPKERKGRGVYYTPEPVVSYIVRSVDHLLMNEFGLPDGLADSSKVESKSREAHKVLILDPATGTGSFLYRVVNQIYDHQMAKGQKGAWSGYVSKHLLPRLFGFELLMAPYAVAHLKLGVLLKETGYDFKAEERLRVYLTNTLEEAHKMSGLPLFTQELAEEASAAGDVKKGFPVMVVLGNPPYSKLPANKGEWIANLLRGVDVQSGERTANYFEVDGKPLGERNPKWLNNDYVKFIRFAQWRIEKTGYGILAFISDHSYLDNPTFRGMRQSLMRTFDELYILDLHGNTNKKERCPDGSKDENVFAIKEGVAIGLFVKRPRKRNISNAVNDLAKVRHAELWGLRDAKYKWLDRAELNTTKWAGLKPLSPFYRFVPQDTAFLSEYNQGWLVTRIFEVYASTVTTARNDFSMAFDPKVLVARIGDLRNRDLSDNLIRDRYGLKDVSYWTLSSARQELSPINQIEDYIKPYCYRPFDFRFVYYHPAVCERLRSEVMAHMRDDNVAFLTHRPYSPGDFTFAYCTRMIGDQCVAANKSSGGGNSFQFPLYLYSDARKKELFDSANQQDRRISNFSQEFIANLSDRLKLDFILDGKGDSKKTFGPEDVFDFIYAVFHSPAYRKRYSEFLRTDFPRLPLTSNPKLFRDLCALGEELVALHLMEKHGPDLTAYPVKGEDMVEAVRFTEPGQGAKKGRVWINKTQYFEGVPPEVWNFQIGGYQVCHKWLKDRKGRKLEYDDIQHYQHIVSALSETIRLMAEIDKSITQHGGWPIS